MTRHTKRYHLFEEPGKNLQQHLVFSIGEKVFSESLGKNSLVG